MKLNLRHLAVAVLLTLMVAEGSAWAGNREEFEERFEKAQAVMTATVCELRSYYQTNQYGDRLIFSLARLCPEEVFKAPCAEPFLLEIEGGTVDGVTLRNTELPLLKTGDRAVFLLTPSPTRPGAFNLSGGGEGYFWFQDKTHLVDFDSRLSVTLSTIRSVARSAR